jgi:hypothetical protein
LVELIPDFVNEEYKTKNQRVRPESHMSNGPDGGFNKSEVESRYAGKDETDTIANSDEKFNEENAFLMKN